MEHRRIPDPETADPGNAELQLGIHGAALPHGARMKTAPYGT